jgi:hypothetical protein
MKLPAVEFSPKVIMIDRKYKWEFWDYMQKFELKNETASEPNLINPPKRHFKTRGQMAKYIRDLLSDPTRRAWIHGDTLNIVRRES